MARPKSNGTNASTATIGFKAKLWLTADTALRGSAFVQTGGKLQAMAERPDNFRNNMDAAEPSGANRVERDSLHEVQPARAGAAAHGKQPARQGSPQGQRGGAEQYKHVVLGLIFLKYISDAAGKCRMSNDEVRTRSARPLRHSKFVIRHLPPPADARWSHLQASAKQPAIGKTVDDAMVAIERDWQMAAAEARMWN